MGGGGEEEHEPCEWVGTLRIPLKPGTASGYVGVQRVKSKKRPWQAMISSRQETTMCGVLQGTRACCSGQGRSKGLRRPSAPESAKAGFTKLRFGDMPARREVDVASWSRGDRLLWGKTGRLTHAPTAQHARR